MAFDLQPLLTGSLLALRPLRADDFPDLFVVASDPLIWEQHPARDRYQELVFRAFFRGAMESGGALLATDLADGRVIGSSRFHGYDEARSEIEIGWTFLARSHWGGAYNREMKQLMLRHAFHFVKSVVFLVGPENMRSQRALEKIGAVRVAPRLDEQGRERVVYRIGNADTEHETRPSTMTERLLADKPERLIAFLRRRLPDWKRKTLEQRLQAGCVRVNGETVTRNDVLALHDEVVVSGEDEADRPRSGGLPILYEDDALIAVDKPAGLLSVSTDRRHERTALAIVRDCLSSPGRPAWLWPVHRLDRETSGVLLFAKSREAQELVQERWGAARKRYLALVEGHPRPRDGVIDQPLYEDKSLNVRVGDHPQAKPARTRYSTRDELRRTSLLEVELDTGRRHQIRAHLAWLGHPIVGDPRYGTKGPIMGLHALSLAVAHPHDGREIVLEAPPAAAFTALLRASARS